MKKIITITTLSILTFFNLFAQLSHYKSLDILNQCSFKIDDILESQGKLNGNVKKVSYHSGYTAVTLNYDKSGNLTFATYQDPTYKQEKDLYYDEQGTLYMEKSPCFIFNGTSFDKTDSVTLHYRKLYNEADSSTYWSVVKPYGKKIASAAIDHIFPNKNYREIVIFTCAQNTTYHLEDTVMLRKIDNVEWGKKMIKEGELINYQKIKWTYNEKNKPYLLEELRLGQGDTEAAPIKYECIYEKDDIGTLKGGKEPYYRFKLNRFGEVMTVKSFDAKTEEKFQYDKFGNWISHSYKTIKKSKIVEINETRRIEYYTE